MVLNKYFVGIEDNKPRAVKAMTEAFRVKGKTSVEVVALPTKYPQGAEKNAYKSTY